MASVTGKKNDWKSGLTLFHMPGGGGGGGRGRFYLPLDCLFITFVRDAAEPQNLMTSPKI